MVWKTISLYSLIVFFVIAGFNHFLNPHFYIPLIPQYFPFKSFINIISGICELGFGLLLLFKWSRNFSVYALTIMLVLFIPSHVYFIEIDACVSYGLCVPNWLAWLRLLFIHPLLILWVWSNRI